MIVLDFIKGSSALEDKDLVTFEYRLLCSGELYNSRVMTCDWRKSDAGRILCDAPFSLFVISNPFQEFPQELALRFGTPLNSGKQGDSTSLLLPDDEIARDVAALLSLLLRRLITVVVKTREVHPRRYEGRIDFLLDRSMPIVQSLTPVHWKHKPSALISQPDGSHELIDYNPAPVGVDSNRLKALLAGLAGMSAAEAVVLSARLYSLALTQLEHDVDLAYQLLIAAVEAAANIALNDFRPTEDQMLVTKKSVEKMACDFGLCKNQARQIALEACKGIPWASRKFKKFLLDNCTDDLWTEDDMFRLPAELTPPRNEFENSLAQIYKARGKMTHQGRSFPTSSVIGVRPYVPIKAIMDFDWSTKPSAGCMV